MYSGLSRSSSTPSANIRIGQTTQFWTSETSRMRRSWNTRPIPSYFTFAGGGYITRISPMAMGMVSCRR